MRFLSVEKIYRAISIVLLLTLIVAIFYSIKDGQWTVLFISTITFILIITPWTLNRRYKIETPTEIELIIVFFIYATLFLGEVQNFYIRFWWWDSFLHAGSAIAFGFLGFVILYYIVNKQKMKTRPWVLVIFAFSFAITIGTIWEILEFSMDQIFGLNMQKSGLMDTMWDLIIDTLGAIFASIISYIYLKTNKTIIFNEIIQDIRNRNPGLFSR